jgi:hypothetical protein
MYFEPNPTNKSMLHQHIKVICGNTLNSGKCKVTSQDLKPAKHHRSDQPTSFQPNHTNNQILYRYYAKKTCAGKLRFGSPDIHTRKANRISHNKNSVFIEDFSKLMLSVGCLMEAEQCNGMIHFLPGECHFTSFMPSQF